MPSQLVGERKREQLPVDALVVQLRIKNKGRLNALKLRNLIRSFTVQLEIVFLF